MIPGEVDKFCAHLQARNYSPHTVESYQLDLRLFFDSANKPPREVTWREVDRFVAAQHRRGLAATTVNRRLNALKRFYDYLAEESPWPAANPVKPSHFLRLGRPLPKKMSREQTEQEDCCVARTPGRATAVEPLKPAAGMETAIFKVEGMTCVSCETTIKLALERTPGVRRAEVSYDRSEAVVEYDPRKVTPEKIRDAINGTGYTVKEGGK